MQYLAEECPKLQYLKVWGPRPGLDFCDWFETSWEKEEWVQSVLKLNQLPDLRFFDIRLPPDPSQLADRNFKGVFLPWLKSELVSERESSPHETASCSSGYTGIYEEEAASCRVELIHEPLDAITREESEASLTLGSKFLDRSKLLWTVKSRADLACSLTKYPTWSRKQFFASETERIHPIYWLEAGVSSRSLCDTAELQQIDYYICITGYPYECRMHKEGGKSAIDGYCFGRRMRSSYVVIDRPKDTRVRTCYVLHIAVERGGPLPNWYHALLINSVEEDWGRAVGKEFRRVGYARMEYFPYSSDERESTTWLV